VIAGHNDDAPRESGDEAARLGELAVLSVLREVARYDDDVGVKLANCVEQRRDERPFDTPEVQVGKMD